MRMGPQPVACIWGPEAQGDFCGWCMLVACWPFVGLAGLFRDWRLPLLRQFEMCSLVGIAAKANAFPATDACS